MVTQKPWYLLDCAIVLTERTAPIAAFCLDDDTPEARAVAMTLNYILSTMGAPRLPVGNENNLSDRPFIRLRCTDNASLSVDGKDVRLDIQQGGAGAAVANFTLSLRRVKDRVLFAW